MAGPGGIGGAAEREAEAIITLRSLKGYIKESILEDYGEKDINLNYQSDNDAGTEELSHSRTLDMQDR